MLLKVVCMDGESDDIRNGKKYFHTSHKEW